MGKKAAVGNAHKSKKHPRSFSAAFSLSLYISIFFGGQSPPR